MNSPPIPGPSAALATAQTADAAQSVRLTLVTHRTIAAPPERVWSSLQFYEELDAPPPLLLRLMLPRPLPALASGADLGQERTLRYEGGHYARRVVRLEPPHRYEFDVVEQRLANDRGVRLLAGHFALRQVDPEHTDLSITTVYSSRLRPRWFMKAVETAVCRRLQHHLLAAIAKRALQN